MPLIFTSIAFLFMIILPFLIAIKELKRPKDDTPLYIDMFYSKDPFYFGNAFKKIILEKVEPYAVEPQTVKLALSKLEKVDICDSISILDDTTKQNILYVKKDLFTGNRSILKRDAYVLNKIDIGNKNICRTLYSEDDIRIGEKSQIIRWICSEKNIIAASNTQLGRSAAAIGRLQLGENCQFFALYGNPIITSNASKEQINGMITFNYPPKSFLSKRPAWRIIKKHVSINCMFDSYGKDKAKEIEKNTGQSCCETEPGQGACNEDHWDVSDEQVTIKPSTVIKTNFAARKELVINENCKIQCAVKAYKNLIIKNNVEIHGDIFCEMDIFIGDNCILLGNIFSQSKIVIGQNVRISQPGMVKSIIGKKKIEIGRNAIIHGYVLTEGEGVTRC